MKVKEAKLMKIFFGYTKYTVTKHGTNPVNRNNVKLSYSCMPNIASIIKRHNNKIMKTNCKKLDDSCNCRKKESCPMKGGNCRKSNVIYEASIITNNNTKTYI